MNIQGDGFSVFAGSWVPSGDRPFSVRTLVASATRRKHLTAQVKAECPSHTESEIEARLEQFGA